MTDNILKQIDCIMDSDTLPELTDEEYENIQNIQDELARSGFGTADTLKQNLYSTKLQQMPLSDDPTTSSRSTPATITSALKGPQALLMQDTVGPPRKAVSWGTHQPPCSTVSFSPTSLMAHYQIRHQSRQTQKTRHQMKFLTYT